MTTIIIVCTIAIITVAALNWAKARKEAYEAKLIRRELLKMLDRRELAR